MHTEDELIHQIVLACRGLAANGCDTGIGGHVSMRGSDGESFYMNVFDRTLGEITHDDVLHLDFEGNKLGGTRQVSEGWQFHADIYKLRDDVDAIVHTHAFWVTALASLARPLKMRHNLCTLFYDKQVMSPDDRFENIGPALDGGNHTIIIPWHGAITVGDDLHRTAARMVTLENMARMDVTLEGTDAPELPEEARLGLRKLIDDVSGYLEQTWDMMVRQAERSLAATG